MTEFKNYKLGFLPVVYKTINEHTIKQIEDYVFEVLEPEEPENVYFLTDDEKWFDRKYVEDLIYSVNVFLIVITGDKSFKIRRNYFNFIEYNVPWYEYLSRAYNKFTDEIICNKEYTYFHEQYELKKRQESIPIGESNLDDFLDYLRKESNGWEDDYQDNRKVEQISLFE